MTMLKELTHTVQIEVASGAPYNESFPDSHAYTITLTYQGRMMQTPFYTGRGWTREPDSYDVLEALLSDASVAGYDQFEQWAADLGYDPDSRRAEKIYHACVEQTAQLRQLLGDDFEAFAEAER